MASGQRSIDSELIRYRIEKRMAGRRDLLLHLLLYIGVAIVYMLTNAIHRPSEYLVLGGLWTIPLVLHTLRYYYRSGPGAFRRADEIERAIDEQIDRTALDEDDELLIEERMSKRILARRILVAHGVASILFLTSSIPYYLGQTIWLDSSFYMSRLFMYFATAFALHAIRFLFVHGPSPGGRALKIDAEIERVWQRSRERSQARRELSENDDESPALVIGNLQGRRLRLTAEGEFDQDIDDAASASGRSARG